MTLPKSITFHGFTIPVNMVKNLFRDYNIYGEYNEFEHCINLDADMCEHKKELVFCHEWIEMVKDMYLLEELDHDLIQPIAVAVHELIQSKQVAFD